MLKDWEECLLKSYVVQVRQNLNNRDGLKSILLETGYTSEELDALILENTGLTHIEHLQHTDNCTH